jgi:microcystin-dependent protein
MSTLKWFSLNVPADVSRSDPKFLTYSGNLKVRGDIDIAGRLVREGKIIGESGKDSLPIGSIIRFPETSELPEGYLRTDGSSIGRFGDNELLWEVIGLDFEDPPGQPTSDTSFRLPDIEGHIIKYKIVNDVARESDSWNYSAGGITYFSPPEATVGIGMTNPNPLYSLDVAGSINFTGEILRNGVPFVGDGGNGGEGGWSTGLNRIYTATVLSEDITVSKVGIGISNPQSALHIVDVVENFDDFKGLTIGRPSSFTVFNHTSFTAGNDILYIQGVTRQDGVSSYNNNIILNPKGGNVGIGTTQSPVYLLDVNGDINLTGDILINGVPVLSAGPSSLPRWEVQGNNLFYSNGNVGIGTVGGTNRLTVEGNINLTGDSREIRVNNEFLISTTSLANTIVDSSLTTVGTLTSLNVDGNVGLGTFVGINRLSVEGNTNLTSTGSSYRIGNLSVLSNTTLGSSVINSSLRTVGYLTNLNVQGNVGIGTTNPVYNLDVFGDININGNILRNGSIFTGSGSWNETGESVYSDVRVGINTSSPQSDLHVYKSSDIFSRSDGIRIGNDNAYGIFNMIEDDNIFISNTKPYLLIQGATNDQTEIDISLNALGGNVGIGVSDPKSRLHVLGTAQVNVEPGYLWRAVEAGIPSSDVVFIRYVEGDEGVEDYYIGLQNGTMLSTKDFETFVPYILPADFLVKDIIFFGNLYFICGSSPFSQPKMYNSLDKSTWSPMLEIPNELRSFAEGEENMVVVGSDNFIAYYPFVEPPPPPTTLTWNVTSNIDDTAYVFSGESSGENVSITVVQGTILEFNVNAPGQPFWIKNVQVTGTEGAVETGVTNNGTAVGTVTVDTSQLSTGEFYYISENVESMFGIINITEEPRETLTWNVTNNIDNTAYVFSGESSGENVSITVERGVVLVFDVNVVGQPFWIKTEPVIGTEAAVDFGVNGNGSEEGAVIFDTQEVISGTYYYISENTAVMTGTIIITNPPIVASEWEPITVTGNWRKAAFGLNQYYAIGDSGAVATSINGESWKIQTTGITQNLLSIAIDNEVIVGGVDGVIYSALQEEPSLDIQQTFEVTVAPKDSEHPFFGIGSENAFVFNATHPIELERGKTYRFLQEDPSNSTPEAHPLYISSTPEGGDFENTAFSPETHNYQGTLGEVGAYLDYTVPFNAPDILYFACQIHSSMGRSFNVVGSAEQDFVLRTSGVSTDIVHLVWNEMMNIYVAFTRDGKLLQSEDSIVWEPLIDIEIVTNVTSALWSQEDMFYIVGGPDGQLTISDSSQSIFRTERTCVLVSGKLGVNTDAPNEALDVVGNINISENSVYKINGSEVLSSTTLGNSVVNSSLTSVGVLDSLQVAGDTIIQGNLTVNGTQTIVNTEVEETSRLEVTNNGTGPAVMINQTGDQPIADFQDDGVSVFFIDDGGNVGIGSTQPTEALDVVGNAVVSGDLAVDTNVLFVNSTDNRVGVNTDAPTEALDVVGNAVVSGDLAVDTNVLFVNSTDNRVGVNTDAPMEALDVVGNAVVSGDLAVDTNVLFVNSTDNRVGVNTDAPTEALDVVGNAVVSGDFAVDTNVLFVNSTDNRVGVNTDAPTEALDVVGNAVVSGDLSVDTNVLFVNSTDNRVGVNTDAPTEALDVVGNAVVSGDLSVDTNVLFVNSTDNRVGVNTDVPAYSLDVVGDARVTGNFTFGNATMYYKADTTRLGINIEEPTVELDILGKAKIESNTGYTLEVVGDINFTGGLFQNDIPFVSGGGGGGGDVGDSLPIGAFVKYPWSAPIPEGYLKCDGVEVSRAEYDQLFAVLGEEYGAGDGSTTFLLPLFFDFIIKFRALGATATVDYMPIGSVLTLSWVIDPYPSGWLKCDGAEVSRTEYSQLFAAIGIDYGAGDGSTTFNLPTFFNQGIKYRTTVEAGTGDNAFWILNPDSSLYNITNVGVGTTNPTEKLTVEGNILVSGNVLPGADVTYDLGAPGSAFRDLYLSGSSIFLGNTKITSDPITGNVTFLDKDTNEVQNVVSENTQNITTDSGNTLITNGNVGIGVTNPVEKLVVAGNVDITSGSTYKINGTNVLSSTGLGNGITSSSLTSVGTLSSLNVAGTSTFGNTLIMNARLFARRELAGNTLTLLDFDFDQLTTATGQVRFFRNTNTSGECNLSVFKGDGTTDTSHLLSANGASFLGMNGNVGIGTTNPTEKLVVDDGANAQAITMAKDGFFNDQNQALLFRAKQSGTPAGSGRITGAIHKRAEDLRVISKGNISRILFYTGTNENSGFDTEVAGNPFSGNYTNTDDIPKMTIINNGNVGIGTTNPAAKLHVQGLGNFVADSSRNMDLTAYIDSSAGGAGFITRFGRGTEASPQAVQSGDVIFGIYSRGRHESAFSTNNVGAIRIRASENFTSSANGTLIDFATTTNGSTSRTTRMTITSSGNVGIGVTNPTQGRLVVESLSTPNSFGSQFYIIRDESNGPSGQFSNQSSFTALTSIFATGMVWSNTGFLATSDSRIKKDIQNIHDGNALEKLRLIEPMEYKYVDHIQRGDKKVFGFVAQQVAEHFPEAVTIKSDFIPDVYQLCSVDLENRTIEIIGNAKSGSLRLMSPNRQIDVTVTGLTTDLVQFSDDTITIDDTQDGQIFVIGYMVDDLHTIKKDYLFTINFAATQELDRTVQTQKQLLETQSLEIEDLKAVNDDLMMQNMSLKNRVSELESQLSSLLTALTDKGVL